MDYVYICRAGDNEELRYSIRSVVKNCSYDSIWVIGGIPDWYRGNYVEVEDIGNKFENIQNCYKVISQLGAISNEFVLMNDDFFITKPIGDMPIFHGGRLIDKIDRYTAINNHNKYTRILLHAYKKLIKLKVNDPLDYDIHTPIVIDKTKIDSFVDISLAPRSLYGNMYNIGGIDIKDVKIYSTKNMLEHSSSIDNGVGIISTEDGSFDKVKDYLDSLFPDKTNYEKF